VGHLAFGKGVIFVVSTFKKGFELLIHQMTARVDEAPRKVVFAGFSHGTAEEFWSMRQRRTCKGHAIFAVALLSVSTTDGLPVSACVRHSG
jgi:hypothetical protein